MSVSDVGFAVVGLGMGANRARLVEATSGARLAAVCDNDEARLEKVAKEHGCEGTTDYHELLGRDDVGENIADGGAGLVGDLAPFELADLRKVEVLARDDLRGPADLFDLGDHDQAALVVADDEGLRGIGAQVHLPRHHLLHGEIAGRHGEFLELEAVLLEQARFEQVVGRHAPDIGLKALPDRLQRPSRPRRQPQRQQAPREPLPPCQFNAPIAHRSPP